MRKCEMCGKDSVIVWRQHKPYPNWVVRKLYCINCNVSWEETKRI